ncbi:MmgE/PrpD family-domain-containing protein [Hypoxylon trugodes]|uniref:MmgE/PrpD family-domain-containing protein n=1 Tax=Hypoxylon trugodes TaxID=326681 RepID=UPI002198367E|nr:MmgE/PrpD family-domain-containing protein [Hypoxylon trugodes]KAI1386455.1 MmgE/PrpD family-domain-containing protein [Hypoxylon trugodes]
MSNPPIYDQILEDIIAYVYHTDISSPLAYKRARIALLDSLGCAVETLAQSSEARAFVGPVVPGTIVPNGFKLPGTRFVLDPVKGAFDFGALIRYLDHNDAYPGAEWGHPSDNLGAIIAVADWLSRAHAAGDAVGKAITVKEVLTAQIKAYEIQGIFQLKNAFNKHGLDHTILVKIASTAVVAHLLGLSEEQALSALSHAWMDGHPLRTFRQAPNAGPRKGWAAGDACKRAVHLCFLAKAGQPGAPSVLTAPKWGFKDTLFGGEELRIPRPFGSFVMEYHFFKLVVAEAHGISAAEAAVELAAILKHAGKTASDIEKMTIRTQQAAKTIIDKTGPLRNPADRDHCIQYIVAVSLIKGSFIEGEDYADDSPWASDPRVDELREKIVVVEDEQFTKDYHDQKVRSGANGLKVELKSGEDIPEIVVAFPIGHPKHPETLDLVKKKFKNNMSKGKFESVTVEEMMKLAEEDDIPVHSFIDLFEKKV